ncbi:MAG: hypothetical protein ACAH88_19935, partial [Roseimicrobium sp.]
LHEKAHGALRQPHARRGTLVFPHKSDAVVRDRIFDHGPMIRWMDALPEEYHPLYVCLYWKDYDKGDGKPFEEAGYPVLSCGHWMHDDFLMRFVEMCGQFRFVAANSFSSTFPLGALCGCHFIYVETGGHIEQYLDGKTVIHASDPTRDTVYGKAALPITTFPPVESDRPKQLALARAMSGYKHVRNRWRIWWLLRAEARHLASLRGDGLDFADGKVAWKDVRPWYCQGIELDGWMHSHVSLIAPGSRGATVLVLDLEFPAWGGVSTQHLTVHAPGLKALKVKMKAGRQSLRVPLPRKRGEARVSLEFAHQFPLPGEVRTACARLLRFRLEKDASSSSSIALEPLGDTGARLEKS